MGQILFVLHGYRSSTEAISFDLPQAVLVKALGIKGTAFLLTFDDWADGIIWNEYPQTWEKATNEKVNIGGNEEGKKGVEEDVSCII